MSDTFVSPSRMGAGGPKRISSQRLMSPDWGILSSEHGVVNEMHVYLGRLRWKMSMMQIDEGVLGAGSLGMLVEKGRQPGRR